MGLDFEVRWPAYADLWSWHSVDWINILNYQKKRNILIILFKMKTFTAKDFCRNPQIVWRTADIEGSVRLKNDRYPDKTFVLTARDKADGTEEENEQCDSL